MELPIAFDKVEVSPKTQPNIATRSAKEQGQRGYSSDVDPSGDNVHTDQTDQQCGEHEGAASTRRMKEEFTVSRTPKHKSIR